MTVKLVAITNCKRLEKIEFRFSSGLSTYTDSFLGVDETRKKEMHEEFKGVLKEFADAGVGVEYVLGDLKCF